jgi:hypothetical protein
MTAESRQESAFLEQRGKAVRLCRISAFFTMNSAFIQGNPLFFEYMERLFKFIGEK